MNSRRGSGEDIFLQLAEIKTVLELRQNVIIIVVKNNEGN